MDVIDLTVSNSGGSSGSGKGLHLDQETKRLMSIRRLQSAQVEEKYNSSVQKAQDKQKKDFKKRHHSTEPADLMPVGSLVLMKSPANYRSKLDKHKSLEGPYRVVSWDDRRVNCVIEDALGKKWPCHCSRVTPYTSEHQKNAKAEPAVDE